MVIETNSSRPDPPARPAGRASPACDPLPERVRRLLPPGPKRECWERVHARYPVRVTPYYLSLAEGDDPDDPIRRQCLPSGEELAGGRGETPDPLDEDSASPVPGLVCRYPDRVLLRLTRRCAVHCRHCFRKSRWRRGAPDLSPEAVSGALDLIASRPAIREVLLSGGDPLLLGEDRLDDILDRLFRIPHVEVVRVGSRLPVVDPARITPSLCRVLAANGPVWLVTHFNHAAEITEVSGAACRSLLAAGIPVVNQSVLLRGVNDTPGCLRALCTGLLRIRVKRYYLFHADPAAGAMHFRTGIDRALALFRSLRGRISGLAVPTLAADLPDGGGKVVLEPSWEAGTGPGGRRRYRAWDGRVIPYADGALL